MDAKYLGELMLAAWPVTQTADFVAAYVFDGADISTVLQSAGSQSRPDIADSYLTLFRRLCVVQSIQTMVAQTTEHCFVVSLHGNTIIQGKSKLNLGLVFNSLSGLATEPTLLAISEEPTFKSKELRVFWRIINALGRCELPRTIILEIGHESTTICADPTGFRFLAGAQDLQAFVQSIRTALGSDQVVRYTLGDLEFQSQAQHTLHDLVDAINGSREANRCGWEFDAEAWPVCCPPGTDLDGLRSAILAAQELWRCLPVNDDLKVTLYAADRQAVATWLASDRRIVARMGNVI